MEFTKVPVRDLFIFWCFLNLEHKHKFITKFYLGTIPSNFIVSQMYYILLNKAIDSRVALFSFTF